MTTDDRSGWRRQLGHLPQDLTSGRAGLSAEPLTTDSARAGGAARGR